VNFSDAPPLALARIWAELQIRDGWIELAVVSAAVIMGLLIRRHWNVKLDHRMDGLISADARTALSWLLPPVAIWLALTIAQAVLRPAIGIGLLEVAAKVFAALAVARGLTFLVRRGFPGSVFLASFERGISLLIWGVFVLEITDVLPQLAERLDAITLPLGRQPVSVLAIVYGAFMVVFTLLVALWLGSVIESRLSRAESLHSSLRVALSRLFRSLLVLIGVLIALQLVGLDLTVLSVFGGALGVGLGFGLQKIASNYMSGFIVLLERSVRIRDFVTIDGFYGEVKMLTTRYIVLRALDGREAIIPNEKLITDTVINHSYTDPRIRVATSVQVEYDCDIDRAKEILVAAARAHPRVLEEPPPLALLARFADSGIELELGFWIRDPENGTGGVRGEVNHAIWQAFVAAGIEFAYPHQDIRIVRAPASCGDTGGGAQSAPSAPRP